MGFIVKLSIETTMKNEIDLIKIFPPKMKWQDIATHPLDSRGGKFMFYGRINIGSPYECFGIFYAKYENEVGVMDFNNDPMPGVEPLYYLVPLNLD